MSTPPLLAEHLADNPKAPTVVDRARQLATRLRYDSLLRNSVYIMGTTVVTGLLGYIYWIVAAREYSAQSVGLASALISVLTLTSSLCNLGIHSTLIQTLPRRARGPDWSRSVTAGVALGIGSSLLGAAVGIALLPLISVHFRSVTDTPIYLGLFLLGVPLWTISTVLDAIFVAQRQSAHMLIRNACFSFLKIPLLVWPILAHMGVTGVLATWIVASAVSVAGAFVFQIPRLNRAYRPTVDGLQKEMRFLLRSLAGNHFINLGSMAPMYVFPVLVAARLSIRDSAYFYTTWMVCSLFFMASPAVAQSLFAEGIHGAGKLGRKVRTSALLIGALLTPAAVLFLTAGNHILALFGPAYAQHGFALLLVLLCSAAPDAVTNIYVSVLRVHGKLRRAATLNVGMAALALALAWFLLPLFGIVGAGLAWGAAQTAGSLVAGIDGTTQRIRGSRRHAREAYNGQTLATEKC